MSGIKVVRVKTYIAANQGVIRRSLDFISFLITGSVAGLLQPRPEIIASTSPQFFAVVATWLVAGLKGRDLFLNWETYGLTPFQQLGFEKRFFT